MKNNSTNKGLSLISSLLFLYLILNQFSCTNEEGGGQVAPPEKVVPITPKAEYTEDEAGEWEEIKNGHLPKIKIDYQSKKENVTIRVEGEFNENHYIEKIGIMDENKQDLAGESFQRKQKPEVVFSLNPIPENPKVKVYVKCNLHDLWTKPLLPSKEN